MLQNPPNTETILLIDDEIDLLELLGYNLKKAGYNVLKAENGFEGLKLVRKEKVDLIVLDIMMPEMSGIEVCEKIRDDEALVQIPILMLTAKSGEENEIWGLEAGADDYMVKPVSARLLISRIQALLRRITRPEDDNGLLDFGHLSIDRNQYMVRLNGKNVRLPKKEFELLYLLASQPDKVFTRDDLLDAIWGTDVYVVVRTVDVHIRKIRAKIGDDTIETVKGVGYKFVTPDLQSA
jgi:two-component system alkaline phosphatase synthesis response regulator PhoP